MRVGCGLFMLLIAACLGWGAFNWSHNARMANKKTGIEGVAAWMSNEQKNSESVALQFGVGAGIFGIIALIVLASGGGSSTPNPQPQPIVMVQPSRREPLLVEPVKPEPVEQRLAKLTDLLAKGLITEREYESRRQRILDDL